MERGIRRRAAALALAGCALTAAATGASARPASAVPLRAADCSPVENPAGRLLIVSDLPLHGSERSQSMQIASAIAFELARRGWTAGQFSLAYQSCDDSTAASGSWDPTACSGNAARDAADGSVVAVIGTLNSGCAERELPLLNRAPDGPLAMISPSDTYPGLTHAAPGTVAGEPDVYYPTGKRNFARLVATDDVEGAADATLVRDLHLTRLFVLHDTDAYGLGIAADTADAARKLGLTVVANIGWNPQAGSYAKLALQVARSGAGAVFLGGLIGENGGRLIAQIRAAAPEVKIIAPDGFTPVSADLQQSGGTANGMYISVAGLPDRRLPPAGRAFVAAFSASLDGATVDPSAVQAAQAVDVLVSAIAAGGGTRAGTAAQLSRVRIPSGLLGPIAFDPEGDLSAAPVTIYKLVDGRTTIDRTIVPTRSLPSSP